MSNPNPLETCRRILRDREKLLKHRHKKSIAREDLESTIAILERDLYDARRRLHKKNDSSGDFLQREETLHLLKKQKIELDRWLDSSEEITEEDLQTARHELMLRIIAEDPSQKIVMEQREAQIRICGETIRTIDELLAIGHDLARFLTRGMEEGQSMRRGGWLRYIAGMNPNLVIIACLVGLETTANQLATKVREVVKESFREPLLDLLERIKHRSQAKWRWSTLPRELGADLAELQEYLGNLEQLRSKALEQSANEALRYEQWLFGERITE